jgi:hypothetical protein
MTSTFPFDFVHSTSDCRTSRTQRNTIFVIFKEPLLLSTSLCQEHNLAVVGSTIHNIQTKKPLRSYYTGNPACFNPTTAPFQPYQISPEAPMTDKSLSLFPLTSKQSYKNPVSRWPKGKTLPSRTTGLS